MDIEKNTTTLPPSATSVAAAVFHKVSDLEDQVREARDVLTAILLLGEAIRGEEGNAIRTLSIFGRRSLAEVERVRDEVFHDTHRFAFPGAELERA